MFPQEESNYEQSIYEDSEGELENGSRNHPLDDSHRVTLRYDTEKHINPRTGEVIEGSKPQTVDKNPLSYDVQNIEPVAPANIVRKYGVKEEGSSNSSTKDSAYGSMDAKVTTSPKGSSSFRSDKNSARNMDRNLGDSPSRSLSSTSIPFQQNKSPISNHAQRFQKSEEVFSKELKNLQGSSSTLQSVNSSRSNSIQVTRNGSLDSSSTVELALAPPLETSVNGPIRQNSSSNVQRTVNQEPSTNKTNIHITKNNSLAVQIPTDSTIGTTNNFVRQNNSPNTSTKKTMNPEKNSSSYNPLKETAYDTVVVRNETSDYPSNLVPDSPYTSMMNIVQGQIKISPHGNEINQNVVDVSVTSIKDRNRYSMLT